MRRSFSQVSSSEMSLQLMKAKSTSGAISSKYSSVESSEKSKEMGTPASRILGSWRSVKQ